MARRGKDLQLLLPQVRLVKSGAGNAAASSRETYGHHDEESIHEWPELRLGDVFSHTVYTV